MWLTSQGVAETMIVLPHHVWSLTKNITSVNKLSTVLQSGHCPGVNVRGGIKKTIFSILSEKRNHWVSDQTCASESCSKNQRKNGPWNGGKIKNENPSGFEHLPLLFHSFPLAPTLWNTQFQMLSILLFSYSKHFITLVLKKIGIYLMIWYLM